jgi:quinol-cytochrome oxidoreductase complex cytochrome b subunit
MLAIGPKVSGFIPGQGRWIFKGDKNPQHPFLRRRIKPSAPCRKILWHVKESFEVWNKIFVRQKFIIFFTSSSCFATRWLLVGFPESSGGWIEFSPVSIIPPWFSMLIYHMRDAVVRRCSLTPSISSSVQPTHYHILSLYLGLHLRRGSKLDSE